MPSVSVLIPFYNHHLYIEACIQSLFESTFKDFDIFIYDDGSDIPLSLAPEFLNDSQIDVYVKRGSVNQGVGSARNQLITMTQSPFVVWQDADDLSSKERLECQYQHLIENPECLAVGTGIYFTDDEASSILREQTFLSPAIRWDGFSGCCATFMLRREVYERHGLYNAKMRIASEDVDLLLRIKPKEAVHNLSKCLYFYRQHSGQTTKNKDWLTEHTLFFAQYMFNSLRDDAELIFSNDQLTSAQKIAWVREHPLINLDAHEVGRLALEHARSEFLTGKMSQKELLKIITKLKRSAFVFSVTWLRQAFGVWKQSLLRRLNLDKQ